MRGTQPLHNVQRARISQKFMQNVCIGCTCPACPPHCTPTLYTPHLATLCQVQPCGLLHGTHCSLCTQANREHAWTLHTLHLEAFACLVALGCTSRCSTTDGPGLSLTQPHLACPGLCMLCWSALQNPQLSRPAGVYPVLFSKGTP